MDVERRYSQWTLESLKEYHDAKINDLQGQLDRRIQTQQRELADAVRHLEMLAEAGDERLRLHMADQISQIQLALDAAEKLAIARVDQAKIALDEWKQQATQEHGAMRRESQLVYDASKEAITKAEVATSQRIESLNGLSRRMQEERGEFMSRETIDAKFAEYDKRLAVTERAATSTRGYIAGAVGIATILIALIAVAANVLTSA